MIELIPYVHYDGIPTFKDSDIMGFYEQMVSDKTVDTVLYDGLITSSVGFLNFMKSPGTHLYAVYRDTVLVGIAWLNKIELTRAHFHFCGFSSVWGNGAEDVARETITRLITQKNKSGEYFFDVFIGIVPSFNQIAIKFLKKCGGVIVGEIPYSVWSYRDNKSVPGTQIYYIREGN